MMHLITSADIPQAKRFAWWQETVCDHFYKAECSQISNRPFSAEILSTRINDITVTLVRGVENKTVRPSYLLRNSPLEIVFITLQLRGTYFVSQDNRKAKLEPGDFILMFTDGVSEAKNRMGIQFSMGKVEKLAKNGWESPNDLVNAIIESVLNFSKGTPQHDDITVLALKWC